MDFLEKLTIWVEEHFENSSSYVLEVCKPDETKFRTYKSGKSDESADPASAAEELYQWAFEYRGRHPDGKWRAMMRVRADDGSFTKVTKSFFLPPPQQETNLFALSQEDIADNPGLKVFMQIVEGERLRTTTSLAASQQREETLFENMLEMQRENREDRSTLLEEMREERKMLLSEMREERQSHRDSLAPIIDNASNALSKATELVSVIQEKNTQVQLAELEYREKKESRDQWWQLLEVPAVQEKLQAIMNRKKKKKKAEPAEQEEEMPANGPASRLLSILDRLNEQQLQDAKRIIGEKHFNAMYEAAGRDDDATQSALQAFLMAQATAMLKNPKDSEAKKQELNALLGEELSKEFVALLMGDEDEDDEEEDETAAAPDPTPTTTATTIDLIPPDGYVAGLRKLGWDKLTEKQTLAIIKVIDTTMTGILVGAAEGIDEQKALVALRTFSKAMYDYGEEKGEDAAMEKFKAVETALGDTSESFANLVSRACDFDE